MTTSSDVIDRQVAAANRRDIQGFVACYAPDAKVIQPDGSTLASGRDQIGSVYGGMFENSPSLRVEIRNRIEVGTVVIDEEFITGFVVRGRPTEIHAAVVYRVTDGLIQGAQLVG
ncbi:MAG TPA: nuclear transport factor 2 family protein [Candidatus Acidoferrum sp.]|nr:nuclear transport factor 2 family protein [Candidatus Acidoferrum sp.]